MKKRNINKQNKNIIIVARVRRRGENIHSHIWYLMWQMWKDKEFLSFSSEKMEWESQLSIWSLGTLTGLRDRVRGLVA
jgi:hypothetical protein